MDITRTNIRTLRKALDERKISAVELCREYLRRIKEQDGSIRAYITVTEEEALAAAERAQQRIDSGRASVLTGIPVAVKDNICTKGIRTTCASRMLEDFVPPYDAAVVERLKDEDCVILGKTSLDEFAMGGSNQTSAFAKTRNPYDTDRVPGGSSGGSAAAVAASMAACALGSDTGGSIRQPAAFCGVTGIKPTYGRISRYGLVAFASSFDQIGPICADAHDCAIMLNALCGRDSRDATSADVGVPDLTELIGKPVSGLRIALPREYFDDAIDSEVRECVMAAARYLERQGAVLVECSMKAVKYAVPAYYLIACAEAASNLARYDGVKFGLRGEGGSYYDMVCDSRSKGFGEEVKRRILLGNYALSSGYYDAYYRKAMAIRQEIRREFDGIFADADAVLTPTTPTAAYRVDEHIGDPVTMYLADICTVTANIAGLPAVSTPCGMTKNGLPVGVSFVGRCFDEATILQCADALCRYYAPQPPRMGGAL